LRCGQGGTETAPTQNKSGGDILKRRLIIIIIVIAFLAGFGALLHSPPSAIDVITSATSRSKKAEVAKLEGTYVLGFNTQADGLDDGICTYIEQRIGSNTQDIADDIQFTLYVSETDSALIQYAESIRRELAESGVDVTLIEYSNIMLRSRVVSGNYEAFIASEDTINIDSLQNVAFFTLDSTEMEGWLCEK
jgi:hypothetical protein